MGLRIMRYRANVIGGSLDVRANGSRGAVVTCSLPLGTEIIESARMEREKPAAAELRI
jgi:signal transduction histidine kinase